MNAVEITILLLNVAATLFMVGLIWFVQIVHYPLFNDVGNDNFVRYQDRHQRQTTWVVGPPMLIEAATSILLVWFPPTPNTALILLGVALLFIIWVSTAMIQIPSHAALSQGYVESAYRGLVLGNWLRTICWTLRGGLVCWLVTEAIATAAAG